MEANQIIQGDCVKALEALEKPVADLIFADNPAFDQACLQARLALPGSDGRQVAHQEAQAIFAEDLPVVPLYQRIRLVAMRVDVCNLDMDPAGFDLLHSIEWLDYGEGCP